MPIITCKVTTSTKTRLARAAQDRKISISELVRSLITEEVTVPQRNFRSKIAVSIDYPALTQLEILANKTNTNLSEVLRALINQGVET